MSSKARQIARRNARKHGDRLREHHAAVAEENRRLQAVADAVPNLPAAKQFEVAALLGRRANAARLIATGRSEVTGIIAKYGQCGTPRLLRQLTEAERERVATIARCEAELVGLAERLLTEAEACTAPADIPATAEQT